MKKRLNVVDALASVRHLPLEPKLQQIIDDGLVEKEGMVLLHSARFLQNLGGSPYKDLTGKEIWVNKFHIEDFLPANKKDSNYVVQQGIKFAINLYEKMNREYSNTKFKIIISTDEGEDSFSNVCTVAFHVIRPNEIWLRDDLESYKNNGLIVIIV